MTGSSGFRRIKSVSLPLSTVSWCAAPKNPLLAPFTWSCQGKVQLPLLRFFAAMTPISNSGTLFLPFVYSGSGMACIHALLQSCQTPPLAQALFQCHLLGEMEDNSKRSYLLSACCEAFTGLISNSYRSCKDSIRPIFTDLKSKAQRN